LEAVSLKMKAYDHIREKIFTCKIMPGDFLDEKVLINEIGASRTPIREALNRLEQEELIQIIPKKGIFVRHISAKNVVDIFQLREMIEPYAILKYGENLDMDIIRNFQKKFEENTKENFANHIYDDDFHSYLVSCANNDYVKKILADIYTQNHRIRILTGLINDCSDFAQKEHFEIIDCLLSGDFTGASGALKKHLRLSQDRTLAIFIKTIQI